MQVRNETKKLVVTAILLASGIAIDLIVSFVPGLNLRMPFGGKFFGISMIPIIMIGLIFGLRYGLLAGFIFGIYNFSFDYLIYLSALRDTLESWTGTSWTAMQILLLILLDYVIPFTAFGLVGLFKDGLRKVSSIVYATIAVSFVRLVSSTLSGVVLWSSSINFAVEAVENGDANPDLATRIFAAMNGNLWLYSMFYNLTYILTTGIVVIVIIIAIRVRLVDLLEKNNIIGISTLQ